MAHICTAFGEPFEPTHPRSWTELEVWNGYHHGYQPHKLGYNPYNYISITNSMNSKLSTSKTRIALPSSVVEKNMPWAEKNNFGGVIYVYTDDTTHFWWNWGVVASISNDWQQDRLITPYLSVWQRVICRTHIQGLVGDPSKSWYKKLCKSFKSDLKMHHLYQFLTICTSTNYLKLMQIMCAGYRARPISMCQLGHAVGNYLEP